MRRGDTVTFFLRVAPSPSLRVTNLKLRFLNDLNYTPTLSCRHRTRLDDPYLVADLRTHLVVRHKFLALPDVLSIDRMLDQAIDPDDDGLRHLVRGDYADLLGALAAFGRLTGRISGCGLRLFRCLLCGSFRSLFRCFFSSLGFYFYRFGFRR